MDIIRDLWRRYTSRKFVISSVIFTAAVVLYSANAIPADTFIKACVAAGVPFVVMEGLADIITRIREPVE